MRNPWTFFLRCRLSRHHMVRLPTHPFLPSASCSLSQSSCVGRRGKDDRKSNTLAPLGVCITELTPPVPSPTRECALPPWIKGANSDDWRESVALCILCVLKTSDAVPYEPEKNTCRQDSSDFRKANFGQRYPIACSLLHIIKILFRHHFSLYDVASTAAISYFGHYLTINLHR